MTGTNKRLLISESRSDSNRWTSCRGKPDKHATRFTRSVRIWSKTIHISCGPHIATLHVVVNRVEQDHCSREKGLPTQSTAHWLTDPRARTQILSRANQWSSLGKVKHLLMVATRLIGPINTSMWLVHSILAHGTNSSVLNRHRRGLQPWRCWLATYHSLTFPTSCLHFPSKGPTGLQFNQVPSIKPKYWV
jgi:hypothetical protein